MGRLHQILSPREGTFFDLFEEAGANLEQAIDACEHVANLLAGIVFKNS